MAGEETTAQSNIRNELNYGNVGLNMDQTPNQIKKGALTYALNAALENFDANMTEGDFIEMYKKGMEANMVDVMATLAIYLDIYNVFTNLLAIFGIVGGDRD